MEDKNLDELPTVENSNSKKELAVLSSLLHGENIMNEEKKIVKSSTKNSCLRTKLQDLYLVAVAAGLFILLANPFTYKLLSSFSGNGFFGFITALLVFSVILYVVYIFMP